MIPENFLQAFHKQYKTKIVYIKREEPVHTCQNHIEMKLIGSYVTGPNMIGLINWSFVFGILLNMWRSQTQVTVELIQSLNNDIKTIFHRILRYLPIGVLFLVAHQVLEIEDWGAIIKLGKLSGLVLLGLVIHAFFVLPGVYFIILRQNPFVIFKKTSEALLTALITASSAATLPITLQCCEEKVKVKKKLLHLMLPIAAILNKNGTAVYEVIAVVFIAQKNDITLDVGQIISIGLTVSIVSFGTAGLPVTRAMTTILVLTSLGLPAEEAYILLVVGWLLDHFNTMVNVLGDCYGVALIHYLCYNELMAEDNKRAVREAEKDFSGLEPDDHLIPPASFSPRLSTTFTPTG